MHPQNNSTQKQNDKSALGYMLLSVLLFSTFPFALAIGNAGEAPFSFIALMNLSSFALGLIFLIWFHRTKRNGQRHTQTTKETLQIIYSKIRSRAFFLLSFSRLESVFFAMSLSYINVAVASILLTTKTIIMAAFSAQLFAKVGRYQKITQKKWWLFALALLGAGFVVASRSENFGSIIGELISQGAIVGILLVLLSALTGGIATPYSLKIGNDISKETNGDTNDEFFFTVAILVATWFVGSLAFIILAYTANETINDITIYPAIIYGFLAFGGAALSRRALIKTANLSVTAIRYLTPIVALLWLTLAGLVGVPHFDWLVIGASAIIAANLLLNFEDNIRPTHKVLIIALWLSATSVYLIAG